MADEISLLTLTIWFLVLKSEAGTARGLQENAPLT